MDLVELFMLVHGLLGEVTEALGIQAQLLSVVREHLPGVALAEDSAAHQFHLEHRRHRGPGGDAVVDLQTSQVLTDPGHCLTRRSSTLKVLAGFTGRVEHLTCVAYGGADVHCTVAVGVMQILAGRCSASPASPPSAPVDAVARTEESPHVDPAVRPPPE